MAAPLFLHVGMMKSGTTYLQHTLRANAEEVLRQGVSIVPPKRHLSFRMALDLRGQVGPGTQRRRGAGSLKRLPKKLAEAPGERLLFSEEVLAGATAEQVVRFGELLGDRDVHVVVTVRDVARAIPSMWQQNIKGGRSVPYETYVESVTRREGRGAQLFWPAQDALAVLERWSALATPERTHVVVVPHSGSPRHLLLERFCSVLGVDAAALTNEPRRVNDSLGRAQAELMRRVNERLSSDALRNDIHGEIIKRPFAVGILGQQEGERILLPARFAEWCREQAAATAASIRAAGYQVVGSLDELMPDEAVFADQEPPADEAAISAAAVDALVTLFETQVAERQAQLEQRRAARADRRRAERPAGRPAGRQAGRPAGRGSGR